MKHYLLTIALALLASVSLSAAERKYDVASPDGTLMTEVVVGEMISYSVFKNDQKILDSSVVSMELSDGTIFGQGAAPKKVTRSKVDNVLDAPFYKKSKVVEKYNELALTFKTYKLIFRLYDAGVAYRFESLKKGEYQVVLILALFTFWRLLCQQFITEIVIFSFLGKQPIAECFFLLFSVEHFLFLQSLFADLL